VSPFSSRLLTCSGSTVSHLLATKPAGFGAAEAGGGEFAGADVLGALPSGSPSRLSSLPLSAAAAAAAGLYHGQTDETNTKKWRKRVKRIKHGCREAAIKLTYHNTIPTVYYSVLRQLSPTAVK
jgi:hypothetical protein